MTASAHQSRAPVPRVTRIIGLERRLDARAVSDPDPVVRRAAMGTIVATPGTAAPLQAAVAARLADASEQEETRVLAACALGQVKPLPVTDLAAGLRRAQGAPVRTAAATALIAAHGEAAEAAEPLARCLLAGDSGVRFQSVLALRGIGAPAVPHIAKIVEESERFDITRVAGLDALGFIGGDAEPALALAERLAADGPPPVMVSARFAVAAIKGASAKAGEAGDKARAKAAGPLLAMAEHEDERVRLAAIERLGWLKEGAPFAGESLVRLLRDGTPAERQAAALGLARSRVPTDAALEPLTAALADPEAGVRKAACAALSAYGSDAKPALDPLLRLVKDTGQPADVRRAAGESAKAVAKASKGPYWM